MNNYGTLHKSNGRYALRFERVFSHNPEKVFRVITNPSDFTQWYPFATGEMDLRLGGKIAFNDGEGTTYEAIITELEQPSVIGFREVDDLINISLQEKDQGCLMTFTHTFDDDSWAVQTAAGWHRCLDVLQQIVNGQTVEWKDNAPELRDYYREEFERTS
ncbi:SRPBCC family protein [Bacillus sp. PS06]|uniref:SRPBCC family protein n=1 Tax=Bacillus sp. PS06 TaxID=2764176 RepID=UPI00178548F9|nr:SRPBCC family protein [Bacillus sp. PS06]MBD8068823.1 SRPBCC family protein [Bacillus sp. PS06]